MTTHSSVLVQRDTFEEVYEHRVLINSGPGNGVFPYVAPPTRLHLQFPRETGLILRCAGKTGNAFQTKQENRHSCCNQEGRRGSNDVVWGTWVFPSSEACTLGMLLLSHFSRVQLCATP